MRSVHECCTEYADIHSSLGKFGNDCRYAHEVDSTQGSKSDQQKQRFEETPEQSDARFKYNTWKRLVRKQPQINDIGPMIRLWDGALDICKYTPT